MYDVLGDAAAQAEIRELTPDAVHCDMLIMSPFACDGCKDNPRRGRPGYVNPQECMPLVEWALELSNFAEMGIFDKVTRMHPLEVTAASAAFNAKKAAAQKRLAYVTADKLGELVARMFGGKKGDG